MGREMKVCGDEYLLGAIVTTKSIVEKTAKGER
jgi:hypothetical protein